LYILSITGTNYNFFEFLYYRRRNNRPASLCSLISLFLSLAIGSIFPYRIFETNLTYLTTLRTGRFSCAIYQIIIFFFIRFKHNCLRRFIFSLLAFLLLRLFCFLLKYLRNELCVIICMRFYFRVYLLYLPNKSKCNSMSTNSCFIFKQGFNWKVPGKLRISFLIHFYNFLSILQKLMIGSN